MPFNRLYWQPTNPLFDSATKASTTPFQRWIDQVSGAINSGVIHTDPIVVADASFLTLPTTPIVVIPSPGAGKWNRVIGYTLRATIVSAYTNIDATSCVIGLGVVAGFLSSMPVVNDSSTGQTTVDDLFGAVGDRFAFGSSYAEAWATGAMGFNWVTPFAASVSDYENQPTVLLCSNNGAGNFTGGGANRIAISAVYSVEVF